jgi:uncharacterized protein
MTERFRQVVRTLLHVEETPHRTALAFGVGVFIAFSPNLLLPFSFPFLFIHMGVALLVAFLFRLNRVAILVGTYLNTPWTLAPMYLAGTTLGCMMLGKSTDGLEAIDWELHGQAFLHNLFSNLRPYLWPFMIGNMTLGAACALVGYFVLRRVLERRARTAAATH